MGPDCQVVTTSWELLLPELLPAEFVSSCMDCKFILKLHSPATVEMGDASYFALSVIKDPFAL